MRQTWVVMVRQVFILEKSTKKQEPKDVTFTLDVRIQERMMQGSI